MMGVLIVIVSFFAAYGLVQMIAKGVLSVRARKGKPPVCLHRVLGVQNAEENVEGLLRSLTWEDSPEEIIVLDYGSTDETAEILHRMRLMYPCFRIMQPEEYAVYIQSLAIRNENGRP